MNRRFPLAPAEGWLTLGLVGLMCLSMAWALDDSRWVLGRDHYLDYLWIPVIGGVAAGFIGAKVRWSRWLTYLIGSIFAALIVPLVVGTLAFPDGAPLNELYEATAAAVVAAYVDVAILDKAATPQFLHWVLVGGMIVWATSMFTSYAIFGHRRPLNGVILVGVVLVTNMSMTYEDQLLYLVLYTVAALLLLIRSHVFDEQSEWLRRRIGDPASISAVYLRGGTVFIAVAVLASFVLTQTAASAPLAGAWNGVGDGLISISRQLARFFPTGGANRSLGVSFGPNAAVQQVWTSDSTLAVTIQRDPTDVSEYYWRAYTYDRIDLAGWSIGDTTTNVRPAGGSVFDQRADDVAPEGRHEVTFTVTPADFKDPTVLSPLTPVFVNEPVRLTLLGTDGYFATMSRDGRNGPYSATALVAILGNDAAQLNDEALRAAGTDYPQGVIDLYLGVAPGSIGPDALALEEKIRAEAHSTAPIDLANQIVDELHSDTYEYTTDVRDIDCANLSTTECFARHKRGFCQYYAATMAVILRDLGVPTRIVTGFLPGARDLASGTEQILNSNAHAWVEVYFPTYGWVTFDPTGGGVSQLAPLPTGRPGASTSPGPTGSAGASRPPEATRRDLEPNDASGGVSGGSAPLGPLLGVTALLLVIVGGLSFIAWQRGPRGATTADDAYGSIARLAARFGFGPRPTQTVYEFAGSLGDVLPGSRPELETVARAKVEATYARQILGEERLASLKAAQRRLRVSLLRLAFRGKERRSRRRR